MCNNNVNPDFVINGAVVKYSHQGALDRIKHLEDEKAAAAEFANDLLCQFEVICDERYSCIGCPCAQVAANNGGDCAVALRLMAKEKEGR